MTVSDLLLLEGHWQQFPPIHVAITRFFSREPRKARVLEKVSGDEARKVRLRIQRQMRGEVS